ncbi:hypothetical protein POVWA2_054020 [Plasmodium ovale wallikeri]|uniref:Uncharacterized protein n=1 Tax=Plasmodium ovale wallikeri TaxID=864142 RepID=A0A1A8ZST4_PLAOA|nr:hypothetical protein POVWA1_054680 [Plasmodium ovale wallikeri]SBT47489.1 hypothetical protein POVWA2_054020 [Plasmodium ovale wallikeri]
MDRMRLAVLVFFKGAPTAMHASDRIDHSSLKNGKQFFQSHASTLAAATNATATTSTIPAVLTTVAIFREELCMNRKHILTMCTR